MLEIARNDRREWRRQGFIESEGKTVREHLESAADMFDGLAVVDVRTQKQYTIAAAVAELEKTDPEGLDLVAFVHCGEPMSVNGLCVSRRNMRPGPRKMPRPATRPD